MAKINFAERAPKIIQQEFSTPFTQATDGAAFVAAHNEHFTGVLNKIGRSEFNDSTYQNKLDFMKVSGTGAGSIVEMIAFELDNTWTDDQTTGKAGQDADAFKEYPAKVVAAYSDLKANNDTPITIHDNAVLPCITKPADAQKFYTGQMLAFKRASDKAEYLGSKQLIHRELVDDAARPNSEARHITLTGVKSIESESDALKVWAAINAVIEDMHDDTSPYNSAGITGQVPITDANGDSGLILIGRGKLMGKLKTYVSTVFNMNNLNQNGLEIVSLSDFGGKTSSVAAVFDANDGRQTADMAGATWTDPHADTAFILCSRKKFMAVVNWSDVESIRNPRTRSTTFYPSTSTTYAVLPWEPMVEFKLDTTV